ncbi:MAG TPA: CPBP family intramembrane glutamic endopeptidase [Chthonomonadales bacterium]|nr:CPBP family intramembrane glutamic endopeptidase [Chthonomonadales bacterium]
MRVLEWLREQIAPLAEAQPRSAADRAGGWVVLVAGLAMVVGLTAYNLQPYSIAMVGMGRSWEEYLVVNLCALVLIPSVATSLAPGLDWAGLGWRRSAPGSAHVAALLLLLMVPLLLAVSRLPDFQAYYPLQPEAAHSWRHFAYHQFTYGAYLFAWEAFFRGFLTFGLARLTGVVPAILLQAVAFGVMHVGKPPLEVAGSFFGGAVLGVLAVRARSFLPCFWLHWAISAGLDVLVIAARPGGIF